ncbi:hypothetical protein VHUM_00598 [Vanrija humicola]|uniref:Lysosomal dipeptide transporter MFSD1 n=1 Tax=Vanrija humicola TaxID=5417 RepID=A0A7D8V360_VANHU|nr:hypothetical protein VHUM_00598 [Vanrija humicola]
MMDRWGGAKVAVGSSFMIVLGSLLAAVATLHGSYDLLIVGEILIGFGSTVGEVCQYKLYPHYVAGTRMATVYGLSVGWSRLVQMIAKLSAVPMTNIQHHWGWAFWISFMVSVYSFAFVIGYFVFERSLPKEWRPRRQVKTGGTWLQTSGVGSVLQLPKFFWILVATQMCQHGAYRVYSLNTTDIQVKTRGTSQQTAGYKSSVQAVIPIVLAPVAGAFFDRFGHRMTFVSITAVLHIIVFVLIGLTKVNAIAPIIISSFAYTTNLLPWFVSLPILVDGEDLIGTAFGVFQAFANSGALVMTVAAGALQDATPHQSYNYVIYLIIAVKVFDVFLGPFYIWLDRMWLNGSLQVSEARRVAILQEAKAEGETLKGLKTSRWTTVTCGGLYIACAACGIALYVVYSLGSST